MRTLTGYERDVLYIINGHPNPSESDLKGELDPKYDNHRARLYGAVDTLQDKDFINVHTEGHDTYYEITNRGKQALRTHHEWQYAQVTGDPQPTAIPTESLNPHVGRQTQSLASPPKFEQTTSAPDTATFKLHDGDIALTIQRDGSAYHVSAVFAFLPTPERHTLGEPDDIEDAIKLARLFRTGIRYGRLHRMHDDE